ncbi:MAG TPA: c-type cytochrome domain-containing protein, partial [Blastocatellia bacterium]|nr:c-type cytochrome domain-containing protein [Blastocatellia bacterium]
MSKRQLSLSVALGFIACILGLQTNWLSVNAQQESANVDFVRDVQPIFQSGCAKCHFGEKVKGELHLDNKALALKGGLSGQVIIPGNSKDSRLVHRLLGLNDEKRMPLNVPPLSSAQIDLIRRWIDQGAVWPDSASVEAKAQKHWAFIAPVKPLLPQVSHKNWVRNPIDSFIL